MHKSQNWQEDLYHELKKIGADIVLQKDFILDNDIRIRLVNAESTTKFTLRNTRAVVYEDVYRSKPKHVIYRIKSILGLNSFKLHGRKCQLVTVSKKEAKLFTDKNHLMQFAGGILFIGLSYQNQLVSLASFSHTRLMKYENPPYLSIELIRYCSLADYNVVGGLDKIIKHFEKNYQTDDIVTTVDAEWSDGSSFENLGFKFVSISQPLLFGVDKTKFTRRIILDKHELTANEYPVFNHGNLKLRKQSGLLSETKT